MEGENRMSQPVFTLEPSLDAAMFYSGNPAEPRCIGHLRMDFGSGQEFWTCWWPHAAHAHNDDVFKAELDALIQVLSKDLFKDRAHMCRYIADHPVPPLEADLRAYGYIVCTEKYEYCIRCLPEPGDYNAYIYCYLEDHR